MGETKVSNGADLLELTEHFESAYATEDEIGGGRPFSISMLPDECLLISRTLRAHPTMLEALERIAGMCDVPGTCTCGRPNGLPAVVQAARAAIRAATGEP